MGRVVKGGWVPFGREIYSGEEMNGNVQEKNRNISVTKHLSFAATNRKVDLDKQRTSYLLLRVLLLSFVFT